MNASVTEAFGFPAKAGTEIAASAFFDRLARCDSAEESLAMQKRS